MNLMLAKATKEPDKIVAKIFSTVGLRVQIAKACDISPQSVTQWKKVPAHWVQTVAEVTGWKPEDIRPDIFKPKKR
jgi:hypothetical protein